MNRQRLVRQIARRICRGLKGRPPFKQRGSSVGIRHYYNQVSDAKGRAVAERIAGLLDSLSAWSKEPHWQVAVEALERGRDPVEAVRRRLRRGGL